MKRSYEFLQTMGALQFIENGNFAHIHAKHISVVIGYPNSVLAAARHMKSI